MVEVGLTEYVEVEGIVLAAVGNNLIPLDMTTPLLLNDKRFPPSAVDDDEDKDDGEDNEDDGEDFDELFDFDDLLVLFDFDDLLVLFGATGGANPSSPASTTLGVSLWNRPCANILVVFLFVLPVDELV